MSKLDPRDYYDEFSTSYDKTRNSAYHRMLDDLALELALPYAQDARVLELGCGTGRILGPLSEAAREAIGVDFAEGMVERARARGLDARLAELTELPFADASFDLTCSFKVLPHVPDVRRAIAEAVRVTKQGGHLLLELYNPRSIRYLAKRLAGAQRVGSSHTEADITTRWDDRRAAVALMPAGTELIDYYGVRVLTPFAASHRIPFASDALRRAERYAMRSWARRFGGFLVLLLRKE